MTLPEPVPGDQTFEHRAGRQPIGATAPGTQQPHYSSIYSLATPDTSVHIEARYIKNTLRRSGGALARLDKENIDHADHC